MNETRLRNIRIRHLKGRVTDHIRHDPEEPYLPVTVRTRELGVL